MMNNQKQMPVHPFYRGILMIEGDENPKRAITTIVQNNANLVSFESSCMANSDLPQRLEPNAPLNPLDIESVYVGNE